MKLEAKALPGVEDFLEIAPEAARQAASLALNDGTASGLIQYRKAMRQQIAFPGGYLESEDRFKQTSFATPARLQTSITGRQRPTSLARFASGGVIGRAGVTTRVKAGRSSSLKKAFLVRLRAGDVLDADNYNVGLAVRVGPGQTIRNKRDTSHMTRFAPNVFLLYAPSVDQVFRSVADTETPAVLDKMGLEFFRQFSRLSKVSG